MSDTATLATQVMTLLNDEMQLPVSDATIDLIEEGLLDSLVFVDLIARLEETFSVEIDLAELDLEAFRSVNEIAAYVAEHTESPASQQEAASV